MQDCQHLDSRAGVARSSPGMNYISPASSSCFHSGLTFIFMCGPLQEENMLILCSSWLHFTFNASSCARTVWSTSRKRRSLGSLFPQKVGYGESKHLKAVPAKVWNFLPPRECSFECFSEGCITEWQCLRQTYLEYNFITACSIIVLTTSLWLRGSKVSLQLPSPVFFQATSTKQSLDSNHT